MTTMAATQFLHENGFCHCVYHTTKVISWNMDTIILNSGGYRTKTTKKRINQISLNNGLEITVVQRKGNWYVILKGGSEVRFEDGMVIHRGEQKVL